MGKCMNKNFENRHGTSNAITNYEQATCYTVHVQVIVI